MVTGVPEEEKMKRISWNVGSWSYVSRLFSKKRQIFVYLSREI